MNTSLARLTLADFGSFTGDVIQVVVGSGPPYTFRVHEDMICQASPFFISAMSHAWKEARERIVILDEDEPETFKIYLHWLYRGTIPIRFGNPVEDEKLYHSTSKTLKYIHDVYAEQYLEITRAYILGDKLGDGDFCDALIDVMSDACAKATLDDEASGELCFPDRKIVNCIYHNTTESSKMRVLMVDVYAEYAQPEWLSDKYHPAFVLDLATTLLGLHRGHLEVKEYSSGVPCTYHQHGSDKKLCYRNQSKNWVMANKSA
jgi:hypothetical protein